MVLSCQKEPCRPLSGRLCSAPVDRTVPLNVEPQCPPSAGVWQARVVLPIISAHDHTVTEWMASWGGDPRHKRRRGGTKHTTTGARPEMERGDAPIGNRHRTVWHSPHRSAPPTSLPSGHCERRASVPGMEKANCALPSTTGGWQTTAGGWVACARPEGRPGRPSSTTVKKSAPLGKARAAEPSLRDAAQGQGPF